MPVVGFGAVAGKGGLVAAGLIFTLQQTFF